MHVKCNLLEGNSCLAELYIIFVMQRYAFSKRI